MGVEERDVWRSPDGRFRLVARVRDAGTRLATRYDAEAWVEGRWVRAGVWSLERLVEVLARQVDRDAREERAG